LLLKNNAIF
jgi:hypothetical protein